MSKKKVTFWIEEGEVELLKLLFNTDNQSETIRLATMQSLATEDSEKVKTLFPYIGKKPPRIGREVVEAFKQSECEICRKRTRGSSQGGREYSGRCGKSRKKSREGW